MKKTPESIIQTDSDQQSGILRVVPLEGLDKRSSPDFRKALLRLLKKSDPERVVVDLTDVREVDTSGLATLVEFAELLGKKGASITVCGLKEDATDRLSLSQVREKLNFCSDCPEDLSRGGEEADDSKQTV